MDFDKRFNSIQRQGDRIFLFAKLWIGFILLLFVGVIGVALYGAATLSFKDIGRAAGDVVSGFEESAK